MFGSPLRRRNRRSRNAAWLHRMRRSDRRWRALLHRPGTLHPMRRGEPRKIAGFMRDRIAGELALITPRVGDLARGTILPQATPDMSTFRAATAFGRVRSATAVRGAEGAGGTRLGPAPILLHGDCQLEHIDRARAGPHRLACCNAAAGRWMCLSFAASFRRGANAMNDPAAPLLERCAGWPSVPEMRILVHIGAATTVLSVSYLGGRPTYQAFVTVSPRPADQATAPRWLIPAASTGLDMVA